MTKETKTMVFTVYRDDAGNPCCAMDFSTGEVCRFYRTQRFGGNETCVFADDNGKYTHMLNRRKDGEGSLIPLTNCPLWNKQ